MLRLFILNITLFLASTFLGQNEIVPLNNVMSYSFESELYKKQEDNFHSGVRPFIKSEINSFADSNLIKYGYGSSKKEHSPIKFTPLINAAMFNQLGEAVRYSYSGGLALEGNIGNKLGYSGYYNYVNAPRFNYLDSSILLRNVVNGMGYDLGNNTTHFAEFYLNIQANKYFVFTLGNGKHFWGDGYRSVILSDNAAPYPFLRIMSSFWNVKYTNLYSMHTDTYHGKIQRKFAASHQLSWNIVKNLNLTIFESVIFMGNDTLYTQIILISCGFRGGKHIF